ncbi:DNA gyrase subunit A [Bacillus cereus]|nr:DNA gyrase subunit A [Bacillus cereus]
MVKELHDAENFSLEEKDIASLTEEELFKLLDIENARDSDVLNPGFQYMVNGYFDYSREVLSNRALEDIRDGLKPVQRFALYYMYKEKAKDLMKSGQVSNGVLKYHPHNADSAYESLAKMVESNGSFYVPLLIGQGNLGVKYSNGSPAASRYTQVKLHENAKEMFTAMDGIDMIWNFDDTERVPEVLPASVPYILMKYADGIAVGFSTKSPSFLPKDVTNLVREKIKHGRCTTMIIPDFATGGYITYSDKELEKLMKTGKGTFMTRGKVVIDGKNIIVKEVPQGVTVEKLRKEIAKANIQGIVSNGDSDLSDRTKGCHLEITCRAKNRVQEVLMELYTKTSLQKKFNSNLLAVESKKLVITGVWGIIDRWVSWRRKVLTRQTRVDLNKLIESSKYIKAFIDLLAIEGAKDEIVEIATKKSDNEAIKRIQEYIDCERDVADWIIKRRLNQFRNDNKYMNQYKQIQVEISRLEKYLENVDLLILEDMDRFDRLVSNKHERRTEITNKVYEAEVVEEDEVELPVSECYYQIKDGFLRKLHTRPTTEEGLIFEGYTNSTIIAISTDGEIFRIYGNDINYLSVNEIGTFIPTYAGLSNAQHVQILWATVCDERKYVLTYEDGFVGFLDTSEFLVGAIKSKYLRNGISAHADKLTDVREYKEDSVILVETRSDLYAMAYLDSIKMKSRTARTRVWQSEELYDSAIIPMNEVAQRVPNYQTLFSKKPVQYQGTMNLWGEVLVQEEKSDELVEVE